MAMLQWLKRRFRRRPDARGGSAEPATNGKAKGWCTEELVRFAAYMWLYTSNLPPVSGLFGDEYRDGRRR